MKILMRLLISVEQNKKDNLNHKVRMQHRSIKFVMDGLLAFCIQGNILEDILNNSAAGVIEEQDLFIITYLASYLEEHKDNEEVVQ